MEQTELGILAWTELIFEAGRLAGQVDKENEREIEITASCFGHCQHRSFQAGSNVVVEPRQPRSETWRREILKSSKETKAMAQDKIKELLEKGDKNRDNRNS